MVTLSKEVKAARKVQRSTELSNDDLDTEGNGRSQLSWCSFRARSRSATYGEIKAVMAIVHDDAKSFDTFIRYRRKRKSCASDPVHRKHEPTSPIRRMFSFLSFSPNPRSLFNPILTLSPSKRKALTPRCKRTCSSAVARVDLPEAAPTRTHP